MQSLGTHSIQIEKDLLILRWIGELSKEDVEEIIRRVNDGLRLYGFVFMLVDASKAGRLPADARKFAASHSLPDGSVAVAMFGASFATRIMVNMISSAYSLLSGRTAMPIHAMDTEEQARAWIEAQRREQGRG